MAGDIACIVAFLSLGGFVAFEATELGLGSIAAPGPGLYPLILAVALVAVSLYVAAASILRTAGHDVSQPVFEPVKVTRSLPSGPRPSVPSIFTTGGVPTPSLS